MVIGGYLVRDPALPSFAGRYLFGRFASGDRLKLGPQRRAAGRGHRARRAERLRLRRGRRRATCTRPRSRARSTGWARAAGRSRRRASAASTSRLRWPRRPATPTSCSSWRSPAACSCARPPGRASSSTSPHWSRTAASRGCWRWRSRPTTRRATGCSSSTRTTAATSSSTSTAAASARRVLHDPARPGRQPQRRPAAVRAGRRALPLDRRRRHPGRPRGRRPEPSSLLGKILQVRRGRWSAATGLRPTRPRPRLGARARGASACCACAARWPTCAAARPARSRRVARCGSAGASCSCGAPAGPRGRSPRKRLKVRLRKRSARLLRRALAAAAGPGCSSGCAPAMPRATAQPWSALASRAPLGAARESGARQGWCASSRARAVGDRRLGIASEPAAGGRHAPSEAGGSRRAGRRPRARRGARRPAGRSLGHRHRDRAVQLDDGERLTAVRLS